MSEQKRQSEMTDEERRALPLGPYVEEIVPLTPEDYANGMRGRTKTTVHLKPVMGAYYEPTDLMLWWDGSTQYSFGQYADGTWFKWEV